MNLRAVRMAAVLAAGVVWAFTGTGKAGATSPAKYSVSTASMNAQQHKSYHNPVLEAVHSFDTMIELWNKGDRAKIESLYKRAIQIEEKRPSRNNPDLAHILSDLGDFYEKSGRSAESQPVFKRALSILEKLPAPDLEDLKTSLQGLAFAYQEKQQYSQAATLFKRALSIQEKISGHDTCDEALAMSLDYLAIVYGKDHKYKEAEPLLRRSLVMREKTYGKDSDMAQSCMNRLSETLEAEGDSKELEGLKMRQLAIKQKEFGPLLGPFYAQQLMSMKKGDCILPLPPAFGPGSRFDEKRFSQELKRRLGEESAQWYKIPDWLAGLWGNREIPPNQPVIEVNGELWDSPPPSGFYTGPGPYASRKGCIQTRNGWWHYSGNSRSSYWSRGETAGDPHLDYDFYFQHQPVTTGDDTVCLRNSTIHIRVKPDRVKPGKDETLLLAATVEAIWQDDKLDVYRRFPNNRVACFSGNRIYGCDGKQSSCAPGNPDVKSSASVSWQKKVGKAARADFPGFDAMQDLKAFLTRRKMFDELKLVEDR